MASFTMSLACIFCITLFILHYVNGSCKYALTGMYFRPIKMDECNDLSWGFIVHSMSHHCFEDGGNLTYKMYYKEECPSAESEWHYQHTDIPCYIDTSIDKCDSFAMHTYMMTYDPSISNEYYRPPVTNDSWEPDTDPDEPCYYDSSEEYYGSHPIYDACLPNPQSTTYPFVKGEYFEGAFETNCSYQIHYYSDKHCRNRIDSTFIYNEECIEGTDGIPYSHDFPDCPWRPNTVWVVVFCVTGCCCFGCFLCYFWDMDRRGKTCSCLYERETSYYGRGRQRKYYVRKEGHCCWMCCECYAKKVQQRKERTQREQEQMQEEERREDRRKREEERREDKKQREEARRKVAEIRKKAEAREKAEQEAADNIKEMEAQKRRNRAGRERETNVGRTGNNVTKRTNMDETIANDMNNEESDDDGVIHQQPTVSYSAAQCVICLDVLLENEASRLKCGHKFHTHCIEEYNETKSDCPLCRKPIQFN